MTRMSPALNSRTLLTVAVRMERLAQRIYNQHDRHPADDIEGCCRLDGAATALSKYGARLKRLASPTKRKRRAVRRGKAGR